MSKVISSFYSSGNSVVVVPGQNCGPLALLLAQLFTGAGLPAGALNVLTGSDMSLATKVAQNPNISYITYGGNKAVGLEVSMLTYKRLGGSVSKIQIQILEEGLG